ncbi:MAG: glutamate--tRNA ligase [bacterium]|nr:glutamate--tRNA ligase [bacterium]
MHNNNADLKNARVRFAPSPTGSLHLGNVRTAIFNWLFARHAKGTFILRMEDTDKERSTPESVSLILESLRWLGLDWDEGPDVGGDFGPYYQMQRLDKYKKYIDILIKGNMVYSCFCTPERLAEMRLQMQKKKLPPRYDGKCKNLSAEEIKHLTSQGIKHVLRFRVPTTGITEFNDLIHGKISIENSVLDDFVIVKSDAGPTYNFACVVDDIEMKITHVIRGDDHISNTPKQIAVYKALGCNSPKFAHIPLILGPDKAKLSKRHGAASPLEYRDMGYLPHALLNFLTLLGWAPGDNREVMSRDEIIESFSIEKINDRNAVFDSQKLDWMNGIYIRKMPLEKLVGIALEELKKAKLIKDTKEVGIDKISKIVGLIQERLKKFSEIPQLINYFFMDTPIYEEKAVNKFLRKDGIPQMLQELCNVIEGVKSFDIETLESVVRAFIEKKGLKPGDVIHPVRVALTGRAASPPIFDVMEVLGKQTCLERIQKFST